MRNDKTDAKNGAGASASAIEVGAIDQVRELLATHPAGGSMFRANLGTARTVIGLSRCRHARAALVDAV